MIDPRAGGDGRHIDLSEARLTGEAAGMEVRAPDDAWPLEPRDRTVPAGPAPAGETLARGGAPAPGATYYGMPLVKPAPWKWYIPAYLFVGGLAGASAALAAAADLSRRPALVPLARKAHWLSALGDAAGAALLIADLGRPARFHHMLRVFRPSSPMNLGTWILSASGVSSGLALLVGGRRGPRGAGVAGLASGAAGCMLATYTAVLLSNTATPLWSASGRRLPHLFGASAAASAASALELIGPATPAEARAIRLFSAASKAAELALARAVEREIGGGEVGRPLRRGRSGALWAAGAALGAASLATTLLGGRRRRRLAGALGTAAALAMRFAVVEGGKRSARDPRATIEPQRAASRAEPAP